MGSCGKSPLLGACNYHNKPECNDIFTDQSIFRYCPLEIGQFQCTWECFGKDKTMRPFVNITTLYRRVNISPCLWLQLVTEVLLRIRIQTKNRLVKTLWQEYGVVSGSWWWAPVTRKFYHWLEPFPTLEVLNTQARRKLKRKSVKMLKVSDNVRLRHMQSNNQLYKF